MGRPHDSARQFRNLICGALNFGFVRGWGRRVQRNLRAQFLATPPQRPRPFIHAVVPAAVV